jgi:hypothetical protein
VGVETQGDTGGVAESTAFIDRAPDILELPEAPERSLVPVVWSFEEIQ